jgi:hypothetical protein
MTSDNWAILNEIVEILEPIKSFTKKLEGRPSQDKADGVTDVYPAIAIILGKLEKLKVEYAESQAGAPFGSQLKELGVKLMSTTLSLTIHHCILLLLSSTQDSNLST